MLMAQAELRQTRTRRQTRRPDYVYDEDPEEASLACDRRPFALSLLFLSVG